MNELVSFKEKTKILTQEESSKYRELYIAKFVNTSSEYYKKYILTYNQFIDGQCYTGFLWDVLYFWEKIHFKDINKYLPEKNKKVLAMWDIHSKEKILIENYWKFGKNDIIEVNVCDLIKNLDYLPEDLYIFDHSLKWSIILTHETEGNEDWPFSRIVLKANPKE